MQDRGTCNGDNIDENGNMFKECYCRIQDEFIGARVSAPFNNEQIAANWCNNNNSREPNCCNEYMNVKM